MPDPVFFPTIAPIPVAELATRIGCTLPEGTPSDHIIRGVAPIDSATADNVTFLSNKKYADSLVQSNAGACILHPQDIDKAPGSMILMLSDNPYAAYAKAATLFYPAQASVPSISPQATIASSAKLGKGCSVSATAYIDEQAQIGDHCTIAPGVYIGKGVRVGNYCSIGHGVTLTHCILGSHVLLHPGVRIGQDGFGFATEKGVHLKVPQLGRVVIEDHVEIGANSCIDRGAGPDTYIGQGTKIDNLVQIGHNVQIGKGCIIVSHVGISGSTKLGDYVVLGGQVGIAGHLSIGSMANVAAQSGVMHDIAPKEIVGGSPAVPIKQWHRQTVALKKLVSKKGSS